MNEIEAFLCEQYKNQEFDSFLDEETEESTENLAQISMLKKATDKALLSPLDFLNNTVKIIRSNMLHIEKRHISKPAINKLARLATFRNPAFYKAQAMRLPTYNKPRLISLAENNADYLLLPRGAEDELFNMLSSLNIKVEIEDIRNKGKAVDVSFVGTLREEQALAVREILKYDTGVLSATTAFGKTVVASNIIAEHKTNTLVLVHTLSLLEQWKKSLSTFLSIESNIAEETKTKKRKRQSIIGQLGGGKNTCNGVIDIALMQSLIKDGEVKEIVQDYGQVIVDECHHVSSVSFEKILKSVTAQYVYGLTATPFRQDGHQPIIFLQCGNIRYRVDAKSEAVKRPFEHFLVPRLTSLRNTSLCDTNKISDIYTDLASNENRNKLIIEDIFKLLEQGRNPIILTERVSHVTTLAQMLDGKCENIILLSGAMTIKAKKEAHAKIEALPPQSQFVIIATGKYIGEDFDFPRLDTLLLAMPIAWKGKVAQYAGRLHRLYGGKKDVLIYDYIDIHIPVLERMYHKRMKGYTEIGYQVKCIGEESTQINNVFYLGKAYEPVFISDLNLAQKEKEVVILSPFMCKEFLIQFVEKLYVAVTQGLVVTIFTRPPDDFKGAIRKAMEHNHNYLQSKNIRVEYISNLQQKFVIIDQNIVWYGSINVLNAVTDENSIMRLVDGKIAEELMSVVG